MTGSDDVLLQTARTIIRPWHGDEVDRLFDINGRQEVARWLGGNPLTDRSQAQEMIERRAEVFAADPRFGHWAVVDRVTGVPAGTVLLKPLPNGDGEIEIGWHLHPDSWGRGLATEAALAVRDYGLADVGLTEIWAVTDLENTASINVCRKLGMRELGVTERWYHEPLRMFWLGASPDQRPSIAPDRPAPA